MRIAHFSDLHLLSLAGIPSRRFWNKRLTGWVNLRLKRGSIHRTAYVRAVAREVMRVEPDHVVVTGDLTNLALEPEFELARELLERDLGLDPSRVTVVPGNHDVYTRGAFESRRFERYFAPWLAGDLPDVPHDFSGSLPRQAADGRVGPFPVVKLRGPVAIVALSSAVPRLPLVAAGEIGRGQLAALGRILVHPEVARRTVVVALHHPALHRMSAVKAHLEGLRDAPALLALLRSVARGLVLHGHLHRRIQRTLPNDAGGVLQVGATSASLHHDAPDRMAGFNVYEIGEAGGPARVLAHVYSPSTGDFHVESVPKYV
jgi:3',5'-cyclic AMP phosphodiesterase CpdA